VPNEFAYRVFKGVPVALAVLLLATSAIGAGNPAWFARDWQSEDGLPNNTIFALAQTPDGYLWLGTRTGLVRFDGIRFEEFSPTNFVAPPNRGIITMLKGRAGDLWLAMDRGALVRLNGRRTQAFTDGLPSSIPGSLAEDAEGTLWVSYHGGSVYRLSNGQAVACAEADGLPQGADTCALASDNVGKVWFAKSGQVGVIQHRRFRTLHQYERVTARLATAREGGVWLCAGVRLFRIDKDEQFREVGSFQPRRANTVPNVVLEDREGAVWIGTSYSGLFRYDGSDFGSVETTHEEIQSLAADREGNVWVGTFGGGLNRVRRRAVVLEGPDNGLPFPSLMSICEAADGTLFAATQNGVVVRRVSERWSALPAEPNRSVDATCATVDTLGRLWIGNAQRGLYCWSSGRFIDWGDERELNSQTLHTLLASRTGDLWVGQENPPRVLRVRTGQVRVFEVPPDSRIIRAMAEDTAGHIWAGTSKGNLFRIHADELSDATPRAGRELASIRCLYATPDGALWIGYAGWGVGRLKEGRYGEVRSEHGLYDEQVSAIVADHRGWLWFSSDKGLFKVRQRELEAVAEGRSTRVRSLHYGRGEGLPSLEGNFGDSPNALCGADGRLWFPMRTALAVVDPAKLGESRRAPTTLLERVLLDENTVASYGGVVPVWTGSVLDSKASGPHLRLPPGHRRIEFEFTALSFAEPENIQFRYRLEGIDDDWNDATTRSASYSRLPASDYVFRVVACDTDGNWDNSGATLAFTVVPFFWQTWLFRAAVLTVFTLSIVALVRYVSFRRLQRQVRVLEQQAALHKERARIAKDIHDDLGANLTQIALLGELAQQDRGEPDKAGERMGKISGTARQAIKSLDEIVWAVNPRNDTLGHLIDYAGQFALDYLRLAGIRCRLDFPEQTPPHELSTDVRHNLFLAIKEALNNVVRHAQATEVWLRARGVSAGTLEIDIEDNGRGFAQAPDDALADGLRNMRQRLADLGGECRIESRPGSGTKVSLRLPWTKR
jgi:signal transduction histidine kinase/ligand-binding sensor domain-containing protein